MYIFYSNCCRCRCLNEKWLNMPQLQRQQSCRWGRSHRVRDEDEAVASLKFIILVVQWNCIWLPVNVGVIILLDSLTSPLPLSATLSVPDSGFSLSVPVPCQSDTCTDFLNAPKCHLSSLDAPLPSLPLSHFCKSFPRYIYLSLCAYRLDCCPCRQIEAFVRVLQEI